MSLFRWLKPAKDHKDPLCRITSVDDIGLIWLALVASDPTFEDRLTAPHGYILA